MASHFRQYELVAGVGPEIHRLRTWLPAEPILQVGTVLTLKHRPEIWTVEQIFAPVVGTECVERTWNNNI